MAKANEKLNRIHIALLIYMIELDVTVFALPRLVAKNIGTNGWVGLLALTCVACFNIWLFQIVYRMGKGQSFFQIVEAVVPKWCAYPFYLVLTVFWIAIGSFIGKDFILIFQTLTFQSSSSMMIFSLYCLMVYVLLVKDIYSILKAVTLFFLMTASVNLLAPFFFQDWKLIRFTTSLFQGTEGGHTLHGWTEVYTVFVGYELCLFLFPYVDKKSKLFQGMYTGQLLIGLVQQLAVWVSFGFFSFPELKVLAYPVIHTLEYIEFPFINRVENLVFPFFLFSNLVSTVLFAFAGLSCLKQMFPQARPKLLELFIVIAIFGLGYIPKLLREAEALVFHSFFVEIGVAFVLPLLLMVLLQIGKLRKKGVKA
ncbi:GerAB/ArcD/ProY family transporter [Cohnella nanjingensis]|uniref:GerAB/ArcD/ProY family transporter n=1 Tax=Cohnella nanjingensis TaxID=1387779 RepID=A0A7X0RP24_9BACL|nr:GerAB/ArcD/ProY family transporter [Cohnella nanjingensis]MBB6669619.1 GerAB/ArcD/ProY family transporter [Cohnella nanjingensis]